MIYVKEDNYVIYTTCEKCGKKNSFQKSYCIPTNHGYRLKPAMKCVNCHDISDFIHMDKKPEVVEGETHIINSTMEVNDTIKCPKCRSTQITANAIGFGLGKAVAGGVLLGSPIGLLGGLIGSKKIMITCLKCGNKWKARK